MGTCTEHKPLIMKNNGSRLHRKKLFSRKIENECVKTFVQEP